MSRPGFKQCFVPVITSPKDWREKTVFSHQAGPGGGGAQPPPQGAFLRNVRDSKVSSAKTPPRPRRVSPFPFPLLVTTYVKQVGDDRRPITSHERAISEGVGARQVAVRPSNLRHDAILAGLNIVELQRHQEQHQHISPARREERPPAPSPKKRGGGGGGGAITAISKTVTEIKKTWRLADRSRARWPEYSGEKRKAVTTKTTLARQGICCC